MRIVSLIIIFFIAGCSGNETTTPLQKVETNDEEAIVVEATPEQSNTAETGQIDEFLEFMIDDEIVSISVAEIPILSEYLQAQKNLQRAVDKMHLEKFEIGFQVFYMLQFACHEEHCSHFLLHPDKNKSAFLIADMAKYETISISPDETKIVFLFSRLGEQHIPLGNIVVFDITSWTLTAVESNAEDMDMLGFKWPINTLEWETDESIAISFPDLIEPNKESWDAWSSTEESSKITTIYNIREN